MRLRWRRLLGVNGHWRLLVAVPCVISHIGLGILVRHCVCCIKAVRTAVLLVHVMAVHGRLVVVGLEGMLLVVLVLLTATATATVSMMDRRNTLTPISDRSLTVAILLSIAAATLHGWLPSRQVVGHLAGLGGDGSQYWSLPATIHPGRAGPGPKMYRSVS